jgi:group I intron endonuclease
MCILQIIYNIMTKFTYILADMDLFSFAKLFKGKSGIYVWTNLVNGKQYVGSSFNLERRVGEYLNVKRLIRELARGESIIYRAMLKYGYNAFSFELLELVEFDASVSEEEGKVLLLPLEQKYMDELEPVYNILKRAGTNKGHKMSPEARAKISAGKKGKPSHRKGITLTAEVRASIRDNSAASKMVCVYSDNSTLLGTFSSITECAIAMGISRDRVSRAIKANKTVDGKTFKLQSPLNHYNNIDA